MFMNSLAQGPGAWHCVTDRLSLEIATADIYIYVCVCMYIYIHIVAPVKHLMIIVLILMTFIASTFPSLLCACMIS